LSVKKGLSLKSRTLSIVLAFVFTFATRSAVAQSTAGDALIQRGLALRAQDVPDDQAALELFTRAWDTEHSPRARAQMGLAAQALERWVDAEVFIHEALRSASDPWIASRRADLEQALHEIQDHLGTLDVRTDAGSAEIWIGAHQVGTVPAQEPLRVPVGVVNFEVRAPGQSPASRRVTVGAGSFVTEVVNFGASSATAASPRTASATQSPRSILPVVGIIAALVAIGVGVGGVVMHESNARSYNEDGSCPGTAAAMQSPSCAAFQSGAGTGTILEGVGFAVGGVLAVVSVIGLAIGGGSSASEHQSARVRCGSGPGALGLSCGLTF
jgi:hypothetical protein